MAMAGFNFSFSVCRAGGKMEFIAKEMLFKGWLKMRAGMLVGQVPHRV